MRYLGIDYGMKRIGIALSDKEGHIAFPKMTIKNQGENKTIDALRNLIRNEGVDEVIIGVPLSFDGYDNTTQTEIMGHFIKKLAAAISIPVSAENEILTSRMAKQSGIKKAHIDASAAALILQSYLDKKSQKIAHR